MTELKNASFTQDVKNELANKLRKPKEEVNILLGFLLGTKQEKNGDIIVKSENASVSKMLYLYLQNNYTLDLKINHDQRNRISKRVIHGIVMTPKDCEVLPYFNSLLKHQYRTLIKRSNLRDILAGLFLRGGTVSNPEKGNYYLGIALPYFDLVEKVISELNTQSDERKINFKWIARGKHYIIYLKKSEQIGNFLAFIGASIAMLNYENVRLTRDYYNSQNRLSLCDSANYEKSLKSGAKNIDDIETVENTIGLSTLGERSLKIIEFRLQNPDSSYTELTEMAAENNMPMSRSTVVKVFSDLAKLAEKCRRGYTGQNEELEDLEDVEENYDVYE